MALVEIDNLSITVPGASGPVRVVRDLSLRLDAGATLGIVGESGSGKSLTALAILGLLPAGAVARGSIRFDGVELIGLGEPALNRLRGQRIAMVFQEPMTSLNPLHRIGAQVAEPLIIHGRASGAGARAEALRLLDRVRIARAAERLDAYPHELSGGQRQRVMIAMALACRPQLLIADEPTSALDVTVQAELVELLGELVAEEQMALLVISHDLGVIAGAAARTIVLYGGAVMETGPTRELFAAAAHPYTQGLIAALPGPGARKGRRLSAIAGTVPRPGLLAPGCPFHGRCPRGDDTCRDETPPARAIGATVARCFHPGDGR